MRTGVSYVPAALLYKMIRVRMHGRGHVATSILECPGIITYGRRIKFINTLCSLLFGVDLLRSIIFLGRELFEKNVTTCCLFEGTDWKQRQSRWVGHETRLLCYEVLVFRIHASNIQIRIILYDKYYFEVYHHGMKFTRHGARDALRVPQ